MYIGILLGEPFYNELKESRVFWCLLLTLDDL